MKLSNILLLSAFFVAFLFFDSATACALKTTTVTKITTIPTTITKATCLTIGTTTTLSITSPTIITKCTPTPTCTCNPNIIGDCCPHPVTIKSLSLSLKTIKIKTLVPVTTICAKPPIY
ncbi:unnamed protein product [Rhizophagus irregularis]|uniref:Uncharacterized protein n=1 Tax=Rhizophagus irregularis TaxID=588596 RepID=A0A2N1NJ26_9GLOM|nr:hypothetical protein RhiirC2_739900 [Rhizophagus irregularis]CAB4380192.1 unnamed protein product [Rhizophagus irregularis]CAB5376275.1 unnamed protein product [Rhizophagus irregularis]